MSTPGSRRLAGIRFVDQPPALPEKLPRMDIAVFVGFASTGPLHCPTVLEDAAHFAEIFGDDLPIAWDAVKCEQTFAFLAPAVRAFFRNGGRRCWVVRVAGNAKTAFFPLPGMMRLDSTGLTPAHALARSAGSGFDDLRAATALTARSFEVIAWTDTTLHVALTRRDSLNAGDLLRLTFYPEQTEVFFTVQSVSASAASPPNARAGFFDVSVQAHGAVQWIDADEITPDLFDLVWLHPCDGEQRVAAVVVVHGNMASPPAEEKTSIILEVDVEFAPPPGTFLRLESSHGEDLWFQVSATQPNKTAGSPPGRGSHIFGRAFSWSQQLPLLIPNQQTLGEKLTFELRAQRSEMTTAMMVDLGFAPAHPRFWNALPNDAQLFTSADFHESIGKAKASAYDVLWNQAREPRFPLAGNGDLDARFLPIGMNALAEPFMAAQTNGASALERDGLSHFSSSLFLDARLIISSSSTLISDADFIRYQTSGADPIAGIHAALNVEEATLIAVPDALQRGWHLTEKPETTPPAVSKPRPHPSWWHFLKCNPPELPPAAASAPDYGHFLTCNLRFLHAPVLEFSGPAVAGAFTLMWDNADAEFVLEEAVEPDFSDAVELWRGSETSHEVLTRAPGNYYYRVRAEAGGESSDWSNGVVVPIGFEKRWETDETTAFLPDALLDIHRGLLRFCLARADIMAVLSLPGHFREDDALDYIRELKAARGLAPASLVLPLGLGEERAFSYAAVYHPWLIVREDNARVVLTMPPDGAACGIIARRSLARGAWIAPANETFSGIVALTPRIAPERHLDLLLEQMNLIRQEPRGFLALNADTLSEDDELRPINVRRLLILLRRAALQRGMTYVFEPNDLTLRRSAQGAFESLLQQLFMRGAFAGATPDAAYRVVTDDSLNTAQDVDAGRFRVDLKVAPALPLSFLTVRLVQIGERATATEIF